MQLELQHKQSEYSIDQQRRTRCGAWCEERAGQPLAPEPATSQGRHPTNRALRKTAR